MRRRRARAASASRGERGYDPARRVVGRKRHALTDMDGRLLLATVSTADRHDSHGGVALLQASRRLWPFLAHCFADQAYQGERVGDAAAITVEIVRPDKGQKGFAVQPRRWVIERTFSWIARCRRLARDYEATPSSALAFFVFGGRYDPRQTARAPLMKRGQTAVPRSAYRQGKTLKPPSAPTAPPPAG